MDIKDLTINPQILEENKYHSFKDNTKNYNNPAYKISYQKRFDDEFGKKYFINFTFSHYTKDMYEGRIPESISWEADVQLETQEGGTINLVYFGAKNHTLKQVENFFETQFNTGLYKHYEYSSDEKEKSYADFLEKQKIKMERLNLDFEIEEKIVAPSKKRKSKI